MLWAQGREVRQGPMTRGRRLVLFIFGEEGDFGLRSVRH